MPDAILIWNTAVGFIGDIPYLAEGIAVIILVQVLLVMFHQITGRE